MRQLEEKEKEINELKEKGRRNEEEIRGLQGLICELKGENNDLRMELGKVKAVSFLSEDEIPSVRGAISECGQASAKDIETSAKEVDLRKPTQHSEGERFWFYGGARDSVVMGQSNRLDFDKPCIIGVPAGMVCRGDKVYFEVTCSDFWDKCVWFASGLAKKNFQQLSDDVKLKGVLDIPSVKWWESNYYGFNGGICLENKCNESPYKRNLIGYFGSNPREGVTIGVAVDMRTSGQLSFSGDGEWSQPWGVAFKNLLKGEEYFPLFIGCLLDPI